MAGLVTTGTDLKELEDLARTVDIEVRFEVLQRRKHPDPYSFIGQGKVEELRRLIKNREEDLLLFNGNLKPSQHFNLERALGIECMDRVSLVLKVFEERATTVESRLQVERARLKYEIPFLREWIHRAKTGERPGFLAGGEYAIDTYYDLIRKRLKIIDDQLLRFGRELSLRRDYRRRKGFSLVCLAGYTNAGKSSLLNVLTESTSLVDDRMFSTLSTKTGRLRGRGSEVLVTDTIGFMENLSFFMIDSFKHTIKEMLSADLVLLVVDVSDTMDDLLRKLASSMRILVPDVPPSSTLIVLNKSDLASEGLEAKVRKVREILPNARAFVVSALTGEGIEELSHAIQTLLRREIRIRLSLPNTPDSARFIAGLHEHSRILSISYGSEVDIDLCCKPRDLPEINARAACIGGLMYESAF
mgnify:CR=1 FL=1